MRALRIPLTAATLVAWMILGMAGGLALAAGAPVLAGYHSFTVLSGSMRPTLGVGDVVVTREISAREVRRGDVITFHDPEHQGRMITHRVTAMHIAGERAMIATKGDANNHAEHWAIDQTGTVGRVSYHLPLIGWGLVLAHGSYARIALVVVPALLLGVMELGRIWRPKRPEEGEVAGAAA